MTNTVHVSFFENAAAQHIKTADLTLEELSARILNASASTKARLPWLKLAVFGTKRTVKKSLRHDANVSQITGIELDYDGPDDPDAEWIGFDQALELVRAMNIKAIVYTSPSHTAATPKWRVLAPTGQPLEPAERSKLVARVNGHMGTPIKKAESYTLSQAFYYGRSKENTNANHLSIVLDGDFIDKREDLKQYEKAGQLDDGRSRGPKKPKGDNPFEDLANEKERKQKFEEGIHGFSKILEEIGDGVGRKGFNDVLTRAAASYVALYNGNPFDHDKLKQLLREAIDNAPKAPNRIAADIIRYSSDYYLEDIISTAERKFVHSAHQSIGDFYAYLPMHTYIFVPTGDHWPTASVNSCIPPVPVVDKKGRPVMKTGKHKNTQKTMDPAKWLDNNQSVVQKTWYPGEPTLIKDKVMPANGGNGWVSDPGKVVYNMYYPPIVTSGNPDAALPWINHIKKIYPDDADHIIKYFAFKVQFPAIKINHAIVLGGAPGIGKDTLLEPVKQAVGPWNVQEISPSQILAPFNAYLQAVILRISEARDQGEVGQFKFHEHMKTICAAPPDVMRINAKHVNEYYIPNCCGVIMTTNHKTGALWLPANDRRTYIAWSYLTSADFPDQYWNELWKWMGKGDGVRHVAAYLRTLDLSTFDAKAPPLKTDAFHAMVDAGAPEKEADIADAIDAIGGPDAITVDQIELMSDPDLGEWLVDVRNRKNVHFRLEALGYVSCRNPDKADGLFVILGRRKKVYVKASLNVKDAIISAKKLVLEWNATKQPPKNNPMKSNVHPFPS